MLEIVAGAALAAAVTAAVSIREQKASKIVTAPQFARNYRRATHSANGQCNFCGKAVSVQDARVMFAENDAVCLVCDETDCLLEYAAKASRGHPAVGAA